MRKFFVFPQRDIVNSGMDEHTDVFDWMLLDYIRGWQAFPKANIIERDGKKHVWIDYKSLFVNMPMLKITTRQGLAKRLSNLRDLSLIEVIHGQHNRSYMHLTEKTLAIFEGDLVAPEDSQCQPELTTEKAQCQPQLTSNWKPPLTSGCQPPLTSLSLRREESKETRDKTSRPPFGGHDLPDAKEVQLSSEPSSVGGYPGGSGFSDRSEKLKKKSKPYSGLNEALAHYREKFIEKYKREPQLNTGKDNSITKRMCGVHGLESVKVVVAFVFENWDALQKHHGLSSGAPGMGIISAMFDTFFEQHKSGWKGGAKEWANASAKDRPEAKLPASWEAFKSGSK